MKDKGPKVIRRSVALPRQLVEEVRSAAPPEIKDNFNRIVIGALRQFAASRKARAFEEAMERMAADPAIRKECGAIAREFAGADMDGLSND
ncbi:MAG: hypothetical protein AAB225_07020 [Acidobacteriota bacterium]